ncbi:response regulator transcription factor [Pseudomonas protegens]|uniref:response regulator transcription factor n=1 Tax=Pseudomonas protegens TaxID=380021 RepID=UPI00069D4B47|nr:response regulator transcription factor [Pseudomonas protegens]MDX9681945.1 response regulator transcription factor [Pseudomonas protegens]
MSLAVNKPLRIAVLDDHALIRMAMQLQLQSMADFQLVGLYASSGELISALRDTELDLLVLDYQLQECDLDGLRLIRLLRNKYPHLLILVSSATETPFFVKQIIDIGANGFLGKSQSLDDLIPAIRTVASKRLYLSPLLAFALQHPPIGPAAEPGSPPLTSLETLSPKENEVLRCFLDGLRISQIASKFSRSIKTISGQKQAAFRKLGIRTDAELFKVQRKLDLHIASREPAQDAFHDEASEPTLPPTRSTL